MNQKEQFIGFLRHYRHDWLNHLQIIKAYISMDKKDELSRFLDHLIVNSHEEARLAQLGDVDLSYFLLTYNWTQDKLQLEVELEIDEGEKLAQIGQNHPQLLSWIKQVTRAMEEISIPDEENRVLLLISYLNGQLTICVDLIGVWDIELGREKLKKIGEFIAEEQGKLKLNLHNQEQLSFELIAK